jgi:hypothetical protein
LGPRLLFICKKELGEGAPHQLMPALWLAGQGFDPLCLSAGRSRGRVATPMGSIEIWAIPEGEGSWGGLSWQFKLFLRLLWLRLRLGSRARWYLHGSLACPASCLALWGVPRRRRFYHTQDFLEPGRHPLWEFFERKAARAAGRVACNEVNRGRFLASHYGLKKPPLILPTALPRDWPFPKKGGRAALLKRLGLPKDSVLILHQGAYSELRCGAQILQALRLLPERFKLLFTQATQPPPHSEGLLERLRLLPSLDYGGLLELCADCDLALLLYPNDGIGNFYQSPGRMTECAGSGLPVLASRFPGLELLFSRHPLGGLCDPESPRDIALGIRRCARLGASFRGRLKRGFRRSLCFEAGAPAWKAALKDFMEEA